MIFSGQEGQKLWHKQDAPKHKGITPEPNVNLILSEKKKTIIMYLFLIKQQISFKTDKIAVATQWNAKFFPVQSEGNIPVYFSVAQSFALSSCWADSQTATFTNWGRATWIQGSWGTVDWENQQCRCNLFMLQ